MKPPGDVQVGLPRGPLVLSFSKHALQRCLEGVLHVLLGTDTCTGHLKPGSCWHSSWQHQASP